MGAGQAGASQAGGGQPGAGQGTDGQWTDGQAGGWTFAEGQGWTQSEPPPPAPAWGPAPPSGPGRASYGLSAGPISGTRPEPVSPAGPRASAQPAPVPQVEIGDLTSTGAHDIRAHRAIRTPESAPPRRSRLVTVATVVLSVVVLIGGAVAGIAFFSGEDPGLPSVLELGSGRSGDDQAARAPLNGRTTAVFELVAATTKVTVRSADLGADLFRMTAAGDSGAAPRAVLSGDRVQLMLSPGGEGTTGAVEVVLSAKVTWGLRFVGGADEQIINFTGGKVSGVDLAGGSRRVALTLPTPAGTVPVRVTGAIDDLSVTSPKNSPVRVRVDSGAKTITAGERTLRDVKPGSTLTPKDWKSDNRYDVDAASRLTLLTIKNL